MVSSLCQMLAPVLSFTADEAWQFVPGRTFDSVHELAWQPALFAASAKEQEDWKLLLKAREAVLPELEKARQNKLIGKALEAKIRLIGYSEGALEFAVRHEEELRELLNVSQLEFASQPRQGATDAWIPVVKRADGQKCERCWHWETDVGSDSEHPTICGRCVRAVMQRLLPG